MSHTSTIYERLNELKQLLNEPLSNPERDYYLKDVLVHNYEQLRAEPKKNELALILKGGGIRGLSFVGAIEVLVEHYSFTWYAGTSAGAITAILLSSGYNASELKQILQDVDFTSFLDAKFIKKILNFVRKGGLFEAKTFNSWLENLICSKLNLSVSPKFSNLKTRVSVYACQRDKDALIFDSTTSPDFNPVFAARCSMSIPLLFTPERHLGHRVFDGGVRNNYPVKKILESNPKMPFIGLYLGPEIFVGNHNSTLLEDLLNIATEGNDIESLEKFRDRTIVINTDPITTYNFKLSKIDKQFLLQCGKIAALKYLIEEGKIINSQEIQDEILNHEKTRQSLISSSKKNNWNINKLINLLTIILAFGLIGFLIFIIGLVFVFIKLVTT